MPIFTLFLLYNFPYSLWYGKSKSKKLNNFFLIIHYNYNLQWIFICNEFSCGLNILSKIPIGGKIRMLLIPIWKENKYLLLPSIPFFQNLPTRGQRTVLMQILLEKEILIYFRIKFKIFPGCYCTYKRLELINNCRYES